MCKLTVKKLLAALFVLALAGCAGGGSGATPSTPTTSQPASVGAMATPTPAPGTGNLSTAMLLGSPGFISKTSATTYVLSADTFDTSACTAASGCAGIWPPVRPAAGATRSESS